MMTYAQLIDDLTETCRDQIGRFSQRHCVPARDIEAALELFVRRGVARRERWTSNTSREEATVWVLEADVEQSKRVATEMQIDIDAPLLSAESV